MTALDSYRIRAVGRAAKRFLRLRTFPPSRYGALYEEVSRRCPRRILEIGTNDGMNAVQIARSASRCNDPVEYYGFDLFDGQQISHRVRESSIPSQPLDRVSEYLARNGLSKAYLVAGDSKETIPTHVASLPTMDLIFIDGGHSYETVSSDWWAVQPLIGEETVIFFDDYPNWGVGPVIDGLPRHLWTVELLPTADRFRTPEGKVRCQLVRVARQTPSEA